MEDDCLKVEGCDDSGGGGDDDSLITYPSRRPHGKRKR